MLCSLPLVFVSVFLVVLFFACLRLFSLVALIFVERLALSFKELSALSRAKVSTLLIVSKKRDSYHHSSVCCDK